MKRLLILALLGIASSALAITEAQKNMLDTLDAIGTVFRTQYAPSEWKKTYTDWSLSNQLQLAQSQVLKGPETSTEEFRNILREFFYSAKDYHVGFSFHATESATLPLTIRGAEGRYFIAWINRSILDSESFPFEVGDEVLNLDGRSLADEVSVLRTQIDQNVGLTDQALAEYAITRRRASRGVEVPRGPVTLTIKRNGSQEALDHQLAWDYTEEKIGPHFFNKPMLSWPKKQSFSNLMSKAEFVSPIAQEWQREMAADNPWTIGGRESFIPNLGTKIWETDSQNPFHAYIYLNANRQLIGYLRIPSYSAGEEESLKFAEIIGKFEEVTDGLVIDQVNNPGGSVFYLYSLVSMLTDKAVHTPRHHMSITQKDVMESLTELEKIKSVKNQVDAVKYFAGETIGGYPVSMTFLALYKDYLQFIVDQWSKGHTVTDPHHIFGVDKINPHPTSRYSKPIVLLINELDFSGGDFFPATLQDNERVTILGTRTAGAGGYVLEYEVPNWFGLSSFSVTGSLAKRRLGNPIENLGVTPDIEYSLTADDFQSSFKSYVNKITETIDGLVKK